VTLLLPRVDHPAALRYFSFVLVRRLVSSPAKRERDASLRFRQNAL
jgi:hypothetical protein